MATLPENDRISGPFTAEAGQVDFDADFPLVDAPGDPAGSCVYFRRERGGVVTDLSLGEFSIVNLSPTDFTVRLAVGAQPGDRCFIVGRQRQKRLRQHQLGGAVRTPTLEDDATELAVRAQEAARDLARGVSTPPGEAGLELPAVAARAGRPAVYGADGKAGVAPFTTVEFVNSAAAAVTAAGAAEISAAQAAADRAAAEAAAAAAILISTDDGFF